jgi:hypothetical protein
MWSAWSFEECGFALQDVNSGVAFEGHLSRVSNEMTLDCTAAFLFVQRLF